MNLDSISNFFIPEAYREDRELFRKSRLRINTFVYTIFNSTLYMAISLAIDFDWGVYAMIVADLFCLVALFMYRSGISPMISTNIYLLGPGIGIFLCVYFSGGFSSPVLPWFSGIPIAALLLGGHRCGWCWSAFSFFTVLIFGIVEVRGTHLPVLYNYQEWEGIFRVASYSGLVILVFVIALVFEWGRLRAQREVEKKNNELDKALLQLRLKRKQIMSSIHYAQRIQTAILPSASYFREAQLDHFILFQPRDIVSGDIYWFHATEDRMYIAVIDCTGHGVPGALLSMIAHSAFEKIIVDQKIEDPATILHQLQEAVTRILRGGKTVTDTNDGMDVCLCTIIPNEGITVYSGIMRPLYYVKRLEGNKSKLIEIKGSRQLIGGERNNHKKPTNHTIKTSPGDMLYLTSDGFASQFSPDHKKYGSARLKKFLEEHAHLDIERQRDSLEKELKEHQHGEEQIDDITVIGLRLD